MHNRLYNMQNTRPIHTPEGIVRRDFLLFCSDARRPFNTKIGGGVAKKPAAFGGVDSYHTDTQATAMVTKLTMNSPS